PGIRGSSVAVRFRRDPCRPPGTVRAAAATPPGQAAGWPRAAPLLQDQLGVAGEGFQPDLAGSAAIAGADAGTGTELFAVDPGAGSPEVAAEGFPVEPGRGIARHAQAHVAADRLGTDLAAGRQRDAQFGIAG